MPEPVAFKQIITYDFPNDDLRTKVCRTIQDAGMGRLQYSVYAGNLKTEQLENLLLELDMIIGNAPGDLRVVFPCEHHRSGGIHTLVTTGEPTRAERMMARVYMPL